MINKNNMPSLVKALTHNFDAWIVGGACVEENPRDYDIFVPLENWEAACSLLPKDKDYKLNSLGGLKIIEDGIEIDIWTGQIHKFLSSSFFHHALHLKTGRMITGEQQDRDTTRFDKLNVEEFGGHRLETFSENFSILDLSKNV